MIGAPATSAVSHATSDAVALGLLSAAMLAILPTVGRGMLKRSPQARGSVDVPPGEKARSSASTEERLIGETVG